MVKWFGTLAVRSSVLICGRLDVGREHVQSWLSGYKSDDEFDLLGIARPCIIGSAGGGGGTGLCAVLDVEGLIEMDGGKVQVMREGEMREGTKARR